jgi:predicted metal-binding membrane protein
LTIFVLLEKTLPAGEWVGRAAGVVLALFGVWVVGAG